METVQTVMESYNINRNTDRIVLRKEKDSRSRSIHNNAIVDLIAEGGVNIYRYLDNLGLLYEPDLLVLSSKHHYYYDEKELRNVRTIVNLKKLNQIKYPDLFLNTLVRILAPGTNLVGCFSDDKIMKSNGLHYYHPSRLYNRFINFLDAKVDQIMNKNQVHELLSRNGLKTIDMREMNGLTYFYSRNIYGMSVESS
jgi:hypothetical protein